MIALWRWYYYYLYLTNNKTEAQKGDLPEVTQLVKLQRLPLGHPASQDRIQKSGVRAHALKLSLSCFSRCLRLAVRDKLSDEETPKCPHISLGTAFLLPWLGQSQPLLASHLQQDSASLIQPGVTLASNTSEKHNEFLNLISNPSITKLYSYTY